MKKLLFSFVLMLLCHFCQADDAFNASHGCISYDAATHKLTLKVFYGSGSWKFHVNGYDTWIYVKTSSSATNYIGPFPATSCDPFTMICEYDISALIGSVTLPGCYEFFTVGSRGVHTGTLPGPGVVPPTNPLVTDVYPLPSTSAWARPPAPEQWDVTLGVLTNNQYGYDACTCPGSTDTLALTECTADFMYQSYSFNPQVFEVFPISSFPGSTYTINWGDGSGFVPITSSHLYAPGTYTLCIKEYRNGMEFCTRCKNICVSGGVSTVPDETTCDFIYRSYSNVGRVLEVIPYMMPSGASITEYKVDWGDLSPLSTPTSSHLYSADGTYTVCLSRYLHPAGKVCEKCISVCIGGGGGGGIITARNANITESAASSFTSELYPNPTSGLSVVQIQLRSESKVSVQVTDITGKVLQHTTPGILKQGTQRIEIDTRSLPGGIYLVQVKAGADAAVHKLEVVK